MNWNDDFNYLQRVLCRLYPLKEDSISLVRSAGFRIESIAFKDKATNNWSEILDVARRRRKVLHVISAALQDYPDDSELQRAKKIFEMQSLNYCLNRSRAQLCTEKQLKRLETIISAMEVPSNQLVALYQASVSPDWPASCLDPSLDIVVSILQALIKAPYNDDKTHPLFEFVEQLKVHKREKAEALQQWARETPYFVKRENHAYKKACYEDSFSSLSQPYLLVKLEPDDFNLARFTIQAWFVYKDIEELEMGDKSYELTSLSQAFERLHLEIQNNCNGMRLAQQDPVIELFLPIGLLNYDMNKWTIYGPNEMIPLPLRYPIVVRSLDRIYGSNYRVEGEMRRLWKMKWFKFKEQIATLSPQFYDEVHCSLPYFRVKLTDVKVVCLSLTFVPPNVRDFCEPHVLNTIIQMGIPIAIWPRFQMENYKEHDLQELLLSLMSEHGISMLPQKLLTKRVDLVDDNQHLAHHITLLWDDPERVPPDVSDDIGFKAPSRERR